MLLPIKTVYIGVIFRFPFIIKRDLFTVFNTNDINLKKYTLLARKHD